jgi:hypothetical protein
MMEDPEAVERLMQRSSGGDKKGLTLVGWRTEHDLLTTIIDLLNHLHATLIQVNDEKGRRPDVTLMPRPGTALTKVEAKKAIQQHRDLVARFLPQ